MSSLWILTAVTTGRSFCPMTKRKESEQPITFKGRALTVLRVFTSGNSICVRLSLSSRCEAVIWLTRKQPWIRSDIQESSFTDWTIWAPVKLIVAERSYGRMRDDFFEGSENEKLLSHAPSGRKNQMGNDSDVNPSEYHSWHVDGTCLFT